MKKPSSRHLILGLAVITAALIAFMPKAETNDTGAVIAEPIQHETATPDVLPQKSSETQPTDVPLAERVNRAELALSQSDPFRTKSWYVAPPPPPPPPPEKPHAPPLPFKYMGMYEDQGKVTVYLVRGEDAFAIQPGEKFADVYRLDKIEQGALVLSYLPMSITQTLPIGSNQ
jgi:hypothetical protein